ncbi:MAG: nicotinate-nucleotide--dimethylbenzimidazole phosphoribosyltransferase [Phototrophicales bacterium]|nr:MAG: nicotinate-nucleotide--dimethylbenzimidazole phosphoribosyltransferase [Phototrophicales bacterium]
MQWLYQQAKKPSKEHEALAYQRQQVLTKPPGALGQLETLAIKLAGLQYKALPQCEQLFIRVFAGDHGVAQSGVSAFPQAVTVEMIRNFARGGAAISVLAKHLDADFGVINLGTATEVEPLENVENLNIAPGTADFSKQAAMSTEELNQALNAGRLVAEQALSADADIFIGGEMGIGNTTSASALCAAYTQTPARTWCGKGTGLNDEGVERKATLIDQAIVKHNVNAVAPLEILRHFGGLEIAALAGAYIACSQNGLPSLIDGFISSAAALCAYRINPSILPWLVFSHRSNEAAHGNLLELLKAEPLIDLGMRLGEGSGAAVAVPIIQNACRLHSEMATFEQAGVSTQADT